MTIDPFHFHPELRDQIACSESSFFRDFSLERVLKEHPELQAIQEVALSDAERDAIRLPLLADHSGDLWIFAYGSLMWDPALRFREVRRAHAPGHARRFILRENKGGRGTADAPGLMAALDKGDGCDGLVFRIAAAEVEQETTILFRRELVAPGYHAVFIPVDIEGARISALTFVANHDWPDILGAIDRDVQVRWIATGEGILGSSRDYLDQTLSQLERLGLRDDACSALKAEVDAYVAATTK